MPDSEDEDDHSNVEETCLVTGFLRDYIEKGQIIHVKTDWIRNTVHILELLLIIHIESIFMETCW